MRISDWSSDVCSSDLPGRYQLPELRVPWWDSKAGVQREIILPAVTLEVAEASGAAPQAPPSANAGRADKSATSLATKPSNAPLDVSRFSFGWWPWLSLALTLLWLTTLCAWWQIGRASCRESVCQYV